MSDAVTTTIYLVRHAEAHNPEGIIYGRLPRFRLSTLGREQAARTAQFLAEEQLAVIYTSPQLRARQTAAAIAAYHPSVPLRTSVLLSEILTSWQGSSGEALGKYFNFYEPPRATRDESIDDVFQRMHRLIRLLLRRYRGQRVVCVSHGDPIVITRAGYAGLPLSFANIRPRDYPGQASVTSLSFNGRDDMPIITYVEPARVES